MLTLAARTPHRPRNRVRGYFDETPAERRDRIKRTRDEEREERAMVIARCLQDEDWDGLTIAFQPILRSYAFRLIRAFELDNSTADDLLQAGNFGLWNAIQTYDSQRGASFETHAIRCARRAIWREFDNLKRSWRTRPVSFGDNAAIPTETKPTVEEQLCDTECLAYILREFEALPEDVRELMRYRLQGEAWTLIAEHQGKCPSSVRKRFMWAMEQLQELVMPFLCGAWVPFPAMCGDVWDVLQSVGCSFDGALPPLASFDRTCAHCGEVIERTHHRAKYCSDLCASRAAHRRAAERKKAG